MTERTPPTWIEDHRADFDRGLQCSLHGKDAARMSREELLVFVGFLDELATDRWRQLQEAAARA